MLALLAWPFQSLQSISKTVMACSRVSAFVMSMMVSLQATLSTRPKLSRRPSSGAAC